MLFVDSSLWKMSVGVVSFVVLLTRWFEAVVCYSVSEFPLPYIMKVRSHDCWTVAALFVNELIDCPLLAVISSSNPWLSMT